MQFLRKLLFPFSILYDAVTTVRNIFFDKGILSSKSYAIPTIVVGNLSVGGTGKSPMIEYLIRLLKADYNVATLSRGYGRNSKGFVLADKNTTTADLGDEPMQFYHKFNDIAVAVDANRQEGITQLLRKINPDVILLDDAYQHRKVKAGFYILLTKYNDLYTDDVLLPAGNLRESKRGAKRADVIIITKCPKHLSDTKQEEIKLQIKTLPHQIVYFTTISYNKSVFKDNDEILLSNLKNRKFTLVTGIATPTHLITYLKKQGLQFEHLNYKDHHNFTADEIVALSKKELIITTEKDYMRIKDVLKNVYYLPIASQFLKHSEKFNQQITAYINKKRS